MSPRQPRDRDCPFPRRRQPSRRSRRRDGDDRHGALDRATSVSERIDLRTFLRAVWASCSGRERVSNAEGRSDVGEDGRIRHDSVVSESETRELLRGTFDSAAAFYERARPSYPGSLFDDLVELAQLEPGDRLLEIGCAAGKATLPMLQRGFRIVCVELGSNLAALARRRFEGLPAEVHRAAFGSYTPKLWMPLRRKAAYLPG
jgi:Mycolic acid cyclopropane synthetase